MQMCDGAKTAAVVVTYNRSAMLKRCIESLLTQENVSCEILVVDNHSGDNTREVVESFSDARVFYRDTGKNSGGAGGFNYGMRWAVEAGYSHVWIMDDDVIPASTALEGFLEADRRLEGNYGFLAGTVLWTDGHDCKMNRPKVKRSYYDYLEYVGDGLLQVEYATFVSLFIQAETIKKVGLPCFLVGRSVVVHAMKTNDGSDIVFDDAERLSRYFYAYRNEGHLYRQYGATGFCYYMARCAKHFLRIWAQAPNLKLRRTKILLHGMLKGLVFNPKIESV